MLITNEKSQALSLLDDGELLTNPEILATVNALNSVLDTKDAVKPEYVIQHLVANQFYLPSLLIVNGKFKIGFYDKQVDCTPAVEMQEFIAAKDNKAARISLSFGNEKNQIGVSYAIQDGVTFVQRDVLAKINPDSYTPDQIAQYLTTLVEPPVQTVIPDGEYKVDSVSAESKSTVLKLTNKMKVRVNTSCPSNCQSIRVIDGFVYNLQDGLITIGMSIVPRGVPLASDNKETSVKIGDKFTFLGITSITTQHGVLNTALVVDKNGKRIYTKVDKKVPLLVLTKLNAKKTAVAAVASILVPGGQRKNYDVVWTTRF